MSYFASTCFQDGHTSLLLASKEGRDDVVKVLFEAGANVNQKDKVMLAK